MKIFIFFLLVLMLLLLNLKVFKLSKIYFLYLALPYLIFSQMLNLHNNAFCYRIHSFFTGWKFYLERITWNIRYQLLPFIFTADRSNSFWDSSLLSGGRASAFLLRFSFKRLLRVNYAQALC